eukprot:Selendium_serpulae@DN2431_c0_g1_i1.p1
MGRKKGKPTATSAEPGAPVAAETLNKTQMKKAARKQEVEAHQAKHSKVDEAMKLDDMTTLLPPMLTTYKKSGCDLVFKGFTSEACPSTLLEAGFNLTKGNMSALYDQTEFLGTGWNDKHKWREMKHEEARFLFALTASEGDLAGFVEFRFELHEETEEEVLYVYEIQVTEPYRRKGLGRMLLCVTDLVAKKSGMKHLICTVLKSNTAGANFFKNKMGFVMDCSSPEYVPPAAGSALAERGFQEEQHARRLMNQLMVSDGEQADDSDNQEEVCEYEILSRPIAQPADPPKVSAVADGG